MQKTLVRADNLDEFLCRAEARIFVDNSTMILTPGAKDELSKRKIAIVYGPCPNAASCTLHESPASSLGSCLANNPGMESLLVGLAATLKKDYGISDPEQLKDYSLQALQTIKANL